MYYFGRVENEMKGDIKMIVMDLRADNLFAFKNFHMNMSYPRRISNTFLEDEFLKGRSNFRYKKVNIIMGGNATGKTSIGKLMMKIFNFISKKNAEYICEIVCDNKKQATFSMDFIAKSYNLYRVETIIHPMESIEESMPKIDVVVKCVSINKTDSYESCSKRLSEIQAESSNNYVEELSKIEKLTWMFSYPKNDTQFNFDDGNYLKILNYTLQALDPSILKVEKIEDVEDSYVIRTKTRDLVVQNGNVLKDDFLSSGTKSGIDIAYMIAAMREGGYGFFYCDEKFSYIHTDVEKAFLRVMINSLKENEQMFFTTHNTDVVDMQLPKHSYIFIKKDVDDEDEPIKCISASQFLKKNEDSLRNAIENDLFSVAPNMELIYEIEEI